MHVSRALGLVVLLAATSARAQPSVHELFVLEAGQSFASIHRGVDFVVARHRGRTGTGGYVVVGPSEVRRVPLPSDPYRGVPAVYARAFDQMYTPGREAMLRWDGASWQPEGEGLHFGDASNVLFLAARRPEVIALFNDGPWLWHRALYVVRDPATSRWRPRGESADYSASAGVGACPVRAPSPERDLPQVRVCEGQVVRADGDSWTRLPTPPGIPARALARGAVARGTRVVFAPRVPTHADEVFCETDVGWAGVSAGAPVLGLADAAPRVFAITASRLVEVVCP